MCSPRMILPLLTFVVIACGRDLFEDEEDDSNEALMNITGPGIPKYNESEPFHYLETRQHWKKCDLNKDGEITVPEMINYFYTEFYEDGGVLTCGNATTDKARAEMDGEGLIKELDQNKDNKLSFEEYSHQYKPAETPDDDEDEEEDTAGTTKKDEGTTEAADEL